VGAVRTTTGDFTLVDENNKPDPGATLTLTPTSPTGSPIVLTTSAQGKPAALVEVGRRYKVDATDPAGRITWDSIKPFYPDTTQ
jgi:hypothetical protein